MSKFVVKTELSNIKKEKGQFTYKEDIVSIKWEEKAKRDAVQSGKGPGEFGSPWQRVEGNPDNPFQDPYSMRKRYQIGHGNESPSPALKEVLDSLHQLHDRVDSTWKERKKDFE